jgi:hypothetical protein
MGTPPDCSSAMNPSLSAWAAPALTTSAAKNASAANHAIRVFLITITMPLGYLLLDGWDVKTAASAVKRYFEGRSGPSWAAPITSVVTAAEIAPRTSRRRISWWVLGNVNAVPADLIIMMMTRLVRLTVLSFSFAFIVTAAAGPAVAVVACAGVLIYPLAKARRDGPRCAEAAEPEAAEPEAVTAAEAVIEEAEAVIAAARLRLFGEAAS